MSRTFSISSSVLAIAALLCLGTEALARPVSYADGWMAMATNDGQNNALMLLYSPTAAFSFGPFAEHNRQSDGTLYGLQANYLVRRWNARDSQGNFYFLSGWGMARNEGDLDPGGYAGIEADWEDRKYYVSFENRYTFANNVQEEYTQKARIGFAPYVADYGALHTWFMLQADHRPENKDSFTLTPFVRLFKGTSLGEVGVSDKGDLLFNFTITY